MADDRRRMPNSTLSYPSSRMARSSGITRTAWTPPDGAPWSSLTRHAGLGNGEAARRGSGVAVPRRAPRRAEYIPRDVRLMTLERDGYACVCCGRSIIGQRYSLGHRLRTSQGGKAVPSNLVVLLGWGGEACHGRIDLYRDPADEAKGYRVPSWEDPARIPVMIFSAGGSGATVWLTDDGHYSTEPPVDGAT